MVKNFRYLADFFVDIKGKDSFEKKERKKKQFVMPRRKNLIL